MAGSPSAGPSLARGPGGPGAFGDGRNGGEPPFGEFGGGPPAGTFGGTSDQAFISYLEANQGSATYLVATSNSNAAAPIILATGKPVMSLGGFLGSDPILSTQHFQNMADSGVMRVVMSGGGPGFGDRNTGISS